MRRVVLGFDVGKTLGYAVVAHNPPSVFPSVLAAGHLTRREHEDVFAFGARARSEVGARVHLASVTHVLIERPPSQVRDDVRHGPQALIGYELGLLSGVLGALFGERIEVAPVELVPVGTWREAMVAGVAQRFGVTLPSQTSSPTPGKGGAVRKVTRAPDGLGHILHWRDCDHETPLIGPLSRAPLACPTCGGKRKGKGKSRAELATEKWKRAAVDAVRLSYPDLLEDLTTDARGRARTERADYELSGVPDACEALCLATWFRPTSCVDARK